MRPLWWLVFGILALTVSALYAFVLPGRVPADTTSLRYFIIRWLHALIWLLLAVSFFLRMPRIPAAVANTFVVLALAGYGIYVLTLLGGGRD